MTGDYLIRAQDHNEYHNTAVSTTEVKRSVDASSPYHKHRF